MRLWVLLILEHWFARYEPRRLSSSGQCSDVSRSVAPSLDRPHRELLRLGRPGDPHADRGARLSGSRPPRHARRACRGADRRGGRTARAAGRAARHPREAAAELPRAASLPRGGALEDRRPQHAQLDRQLAHSARLRVAANAPPIVRTRHVSTTIRNRPTTRWLYTRATAHIVTTGEALRRQLARDNGVPTRSHDVGPDRHRPRALRAGRRRVSARARSDCRPRPTLGIVATLRDWKGHDMLFEALARDRAAWEGWNVVVVGDGPYRDRLDAQLAAPRARRPDRVRGPAGRRRAVAAGARSLRAAVVGRGGRPAGDPAGDGLRASGGFDDGRRDHRSRRPTASTGLIVPPRDVAALGSRSRGCATTRRCARASAAAGRARALADFGLDRMLDRMEAVFRAVARPR